MANNGIIDWGEAMQQCGDDEEFLRELLVDLRSEAKTQLSNINNVISNPPAGNPYEPIVRSAHMLKGASANLMCTQLRTASYHLEEAARQANPAKVQEAHIELQTALSNYFNFLQSIGL